MKIPLHNIHCIYLYIYIYFIIEQMPLLDRKGLLHDILLIAANAISRCGLVLSGGKNIM